MDSIRYGGQTMSTLIVKNLDAPTGESIVAPDLQLPSGSVIQVVHNVQNGASNAISSSSMSSMGRSITITPKFADSIIYVLYTAVIYKSAGYGYFTLYRNGTNLYNIGDYSTNSSNKAIVQFGPSATGTVYQPGSMAYWDNTHNSTTSLTYELYGQNDGAGGTFYWPPGSSDAATFIAMEISG
jgi:hypothetical protein